MKTRKGRERIARLEEMNWREIDNLDRKSTIFFLPIGPLEGHGPHLPVGTDLFIAEEAAKEAIKRIKRTTKLFPVLLPSIPIGHSSLTIDFPGTLSVDADILSDMIYGLSASIARHGFGYMVVCTYHMDFFHLKAIYRGLRRAMSKYSIRIAEPTSSNFCSEHAGYEETSIMRYLYPYLLDSSYKSLPRVSSKRALKETGYIGEPSKATIDYGKRLFNELVELYVKAVINLRAGKLSSPPRRIRWLPLFLQHRL